MVKASGGKTGKQIQERTRSVKNIYASKFDKVYSYLENDEDDHVSYFECISVEDYEKLCRDDFLEVLVTARFSKMKEVTDMANQFGALASIFEPLLGQGILDEEAKEALDGFSALSKIDYGKGIACVFEFEDKKIPIIAYLDEAYFRCRQEQFLGEGYLLCKIIKKIPKGKSIKLDEIFDSMEKLASNREERRKLKKNASNPTEIRDEIKGPALMVLPIAFYH